MKKKFFFRLLLSLVLIISFRNTFSKEIHKPIVYRFQAGDTLGHVLSTLKQCPLWGKQGSIQNVLKHNPHFYDVSGNIVFIGDQLIFPKDISENLVGVSSLDFQIDSKTKILSFLKGAKNLNYCGNKTGFVDQTTQNPTLHQAANSPLYAVAKDTHVLASTVTEKTSILLLDLETSYGTSLIRVSQYGGFGENPVQAFSPQVLSFKLLGKYGNGYGGLALKNSKFPKNSNYNSSQFLILAGFNRFFGGLLTDTSFISRSRLVSSLEYANVTTLSGFAGAYHAWVTQMQTSRKFRFLVDSDLRVEYPLAVSSRTQNLQISSLSGFGSQIRVGGKKHLFQYETLDAFMILDFTAAYRRTTYHLIWDNVSGKVLRPSREAIASVGFIANW